MHFKTRVFSIVATIISISAVAANASATAPALGNLQAPLESLSALTSLSESLQKGTPSDLGKLVDENDCERKIVLPDENPQLEAGDMKLGQFLVEVSGPGCPILYSVSLTGQQNADGFKAEFALSYTAQSTEAKTLYDVDHAEFVGTLNAKVLQVPGGGGIDFRFDYKGSGNSQSQGAFSSLSTMGGKMLMSMGGGTMQPGAVGGMPSFNLKIEGGFDEQLTYDFKSESITMKSVTTMAGFVPVAEYEVNGKKVTEAEYKAIRELVKLPGMEDRGINAPPEASTLECKAETYRSTDFTLSQATQWIQSGGSRPLALKTSRSCGGMAMDSDQIDGITYKTVFTTQPTYTSVSVDLCPSGATCATAERMFLHDESAAFVDELLGRYTVLTSCSVVPSCVP